MLVHGGRPKQNSVICHVMGINVAACQCESRRGSPLFIQSSAKDDSARSNLLSWIQSRSLPLTLESLIC
jgi:hypothetical protein